MTIHAAAAAPALPAPMSVAALAAAAAPDPVLKPTAPRGDPWADGVFWDDSTRWVP